MGRDEWRVAAGVAVVSGALRAWRHRPTNHAGGGRQGRGGRAAKPRHAGHGPAPSRRHSLRLRRGQLPRPRHDGGIDESAGRSVPSRSPARSPRSIRSPTAGIPLRRPCAGLEGHTKRVAMSLDSSPVDDSTVGPAHRTLIDLLRRQEAELMFDAFPSRHSGRRRACRGRVGRVGRVGSVSSVSSGQAACGGGLGHAAWRASCLSRIPAEASLMT